MKTYVLIIILFILLCLARYINRLLLKKESYPYSKKSIITDSEQTFFEILKNIINDKYYVFPQVHLESLLVANKNEAHRIEYFNKIIQKSVDYTVVDKHNFSPVLVIELDDYRHKIFKSKIERDNFVDQALSAAQIPILHIDVQTKYDIDNLSTAIRQIIIL